MTAKVFYFFLFCCSVISLQESKEVVRLPGLSKKINFRHYSGYLKVSPTHFLHYWFTESQSNPSSDPLLLWLNGGPGCSSLGGLLSEQGPFHIKPNGRTVYLNEFAWNKVANVLFLEAPAGVGFSYSTDKNITTNDDQTSMENHEALKQFFTQFPQFRSNELYISGESYGGIYVPTLVKRILDQQNTFRMNIKGLAVGNGMLSFALNTDSILKFAYYHGLVDTKLWETLETTCCRGCTDTCSFHSQTSTFCKNAVQEIQDATWSQGLNVYDLYRDCYHPKSSALKNPRFRADLRGLAPLSAQSLLQEDSLLRIPEFQPRTQELRLMGSPPCLNQTAFTDYLNRKDVRKALFIRPDFGEWSDCSDELGQVYQQQYMDMVSQIRQALTAHLRVLIYSGDTDMACNFLMGQKFSELLNLPLLAKKRPWQLRGQIAGFVTQYRGLDFMTVKGAGHMVPQWRAGPSLHMITQFLKNQPY